MPRLHVFNTGWFRTRESNLYVGGGRSPRLLPVLAFALEHRSGLVVFDTGLNPAFAASPQRYVGWLNDLVIPFRSSAGMDICSQMRARGLPPEEVSYVVLSHLHYDHTGCLAAFSRAQLLVTKQERQAARAPLHRLSGYLSKELRGMRLTELEHPSRAGLALEDVARHGYGVDLLNDSSLILVPTYGHSPGHQALLAFLPGGPVLLAGDATYVREGYSKPAAQPRPWNADLGWRSLLGLRALAKGDLSALILPSHDDAPLRLLARPDIVVGSLGIGG
jgi:N-acyl homoserine lactone hydrolase